MSFSHVDIFYAGKKDASGQVIKVDVMMRTLDLAQRYVNFVNTISQSNPLCGRYYKDVENSFADQASAQETIKQHEENLRKHMQAFYAKQNPTSSERLDLHKHKIAFINFMLAMIGIDENDKVKKQEKFQEFDRMITENIAAKLYPAALHELDENDSMEHLERKLTHIHSTFIDRINSGIAKDAFKAKERKDQFLIVLAQYKKVAAELMEKGAKSEHTKRTCVHKLNFLNAVIEDLAERSSYGIKMDAAEKRYPGYAGCKSEAGAMLTRGLGILNPYSTFEEDLKWKMLHMFLEWNDEHIRIQVAKAAGSR